MLIWIIKSIKSTNLFKIIHKWFECWNSSVSSKNIWTTSSISSASLIWFEFRIFVSLSLSIRGHKDQVFKQLSKSLVLPNERRDWFYREPIRRPYIHPRLKNVSKQKKTAFYSLLKHKNPSCICKGWALCSGIDPIFSTNIFFPVDSDTRTHTGSLVRQAYSNAD